MADAMDAMNERPRMTAEEADARFAALVAEHRSKPRQRASHQARFLGLTPMTAAAFIYIVGILVGTFAPVKPLFAVIVGIPLMFVCRASMKRYGHDDS